MILRVDRINIDQIRIARNLQSLVSIILYFYFIVVSIIIQLLLVTNYFLFNALVITIQVYAIVKEYAIIKLQLKAKYKFDIICEYNNKL